LALAVARNDGKEKDYRLLVEDWLFGSGLDPAWYGPFLAPAQAVHQRGLLDIRATVATAWLYDVRPLAQPVLTKYPFDPSASEDASVEDIEMILRQQGEPGTFWDSFERLIRPAMRPGEWAMVPGVAPPRGMLAMAGDLERSSKLLWNDKGERVPIQVVIRIKALPSELYDGKVASMVIVSSGGESVSGFNQRPEPQLLPLEWWDQQDSAVVLKMTAPESNGNDESRYRLVAGGTFSFHRLLDLGISREFGKLVTPTEVAISRGTYCDRRPVGTRGMNMSWSVTLDTSGNEIRNVSVVLDSDPWKPFAVRNCQ
jgi:type VI protein secretion system component VasK